MTRIRRGLASVLLAVSVAALLIAAQAWACVPMPVLTVLSKSSGPAGSTFSVQGENVPAPIEVRWNSPQGQLLARVNNPAKVTRVKVPTVAPGLYVVMMLSRQSNRTVGAIARAPFYVQGPTTAGIKPAASKDEDGVPLVVVVIGLLVVMGAGGFVLLRRRTKLQSRPAA